MRTSDRNIDRIYVNTLTRNADFITVKNHFHSYYELYYVRHGSCEFYINDSVYELKSGDFMVIPPNMNHYVKYVTKCIRINIYFKYTDLCNNGIPFIDNLDERFLHIGVIHIPRAYRDQTHNVLDQMLGEDKLDDASTATMLRLLLQQLFLYCNRYAMFLDTSHSAHTDPSDVAILAAIHYINEHFSQPIHASELADLSGLSPNYFGKKFHAVTGVCLRDYLLSVRMKHAVDELLSTNHSITDIAINSGFSDSNYFKDIFKKKYGCSPRNFRKEHLTDMILDSSLPK